MIYGVEGPCVLLKGSQGPMKSCSYSEARGNFATVLDEAERDGAMEIRRRDGSCFAFCLCEGPKPPVKVGQYEF